MYVVQKSNNNKSSVKYLGVGYLSHHFPSSLLEKQLLTLSAIALALDLHIFKSAVTPLVRRLKGISPDYLWFGVHQGRGQSLTFSIRLSSIFSAQSLTLFHPRNLQVLRLLRFRLPKSVAPASPDVSGEFIRPGTVEMQGRGHREVQLQPVYIFNQYLFLLFSPSITIWPSISDLFWEANWQAVLWYPQPVSIFV